MSQVIPAGQFFEQDDEETLQLLLMSVSFSDDEDDDIETRLDGMSERFRDDFMGTSNESFWKTISKSAEELGFRVASSSSAPPCTHQDAPSSFPPAFQTDSGKKHIRATSSLLRISETRAVQLTLSALRSINTNTGKDGDESHLQSLLGTRDLLKTVREYHYQQRTARLQIITECLRMEQDDDRAPYNETASSMLETLDTEYILNGHKRGLFQRLLCVACAPYSSPNREELLPTLQLRSEAFDNLQEAQQLLQHDTSAWGDGFVTDCFQASRLQTQVERLEAMEALLVLLYYRIDQGIHRIDYAFILLAFQSCGTFFTSEGMKKRLPYLAGLICAECMSLWMTSSSEMDAIGVPLWITRHPILVGVVEIHDRAVHEMEAILMLLTKYASQVPERKRTAMSIRIPDKAALDAPESIALYSFALLLRLVDMNVPRQDALLQQSNSLRFDFEKYGMECAQIAVDDCGVFDYLHATMEVLVKTPIRDSFSSVSNIPYDWQFSKDSAPLLLEGPSEQEELNAANVAYSSIGLEVLSATIIAFQSTIRSGNSISLENVTMLCNLAATIYGNHPLLCEAFWKNLEVYTSSVTPREDGSLTSNQALCYLVDAAHACAASALNAAALASMEDHPGLEEDILPSLVPLLQLMSCLCSNSGMMESVLKLLPKGTIRIALLCCAPMSAVKDATAFSKYALQIVEAIQNFARVGRSNKCRAMLRNALEEEGSDILDGPRVLYRILAANPRTDIVSSTLRILGYFVESSTGHELWVAKAAKYLGPPGLGENGLSVLLTGQSSSVALSGLHVLSGLVGNLAEVAFCSLCEHVDIIDVLYVVMKGVSSSCILLTTLLSSTPNQNAESGNGVSYLIAHGVLRCAGLLFRNLRPIINMHDSLRVRAAAQEVRDGHIQSLSTSTHVGQAIAYFASAPVSLSLAFVLEEMLRNANVMQIASDEYARETEQFDFGAWRSIADASREIKPAVETAKVRDYGQSLASNIHELDIDIQGFQSRGWTDEATAMEPILAASAALDLLRLWSLAVDDTVVEQNGIRGRGASSLSRTAVSDLQAISPNRLIFSHILRPPIVEGTSSLRQVWPTTTLTLFDVLVRYLEGPDEEMPSLLATDVLSLALATSKDFEPSLQVPFNDVVLRCAPELSVVLKQAITSVGALTSAATHRGELSLEDDMEVRNGLASLRLLSACMGLDARVVDEVCGAETSPLYEVVNILSSYASSIRGGLTLDQVAADPLCTSQLRVASASIHTLLSMWKSSFMRNMNQNVSIVAELKENVVVDLVTIVEFAARSLSSANASTESSFVHVIAELTAATSGALEILRIEMSKELGEPPGADKNAKTTVSTLMKVSFPSLSDTFSKIDVAVFVARSWTKLESTMNSLKQVGVVDPRSLLCSFPATYRSQMESHEAQDNLCDIVAATSLIVSLYSAQETPREMLKNSNASIILLSKQLTLVKSWGQFATMFSLVRESDGELPADELLSTTRAVLASLGRIATVIEEAQMLASENYLPLDIGVVADALAGLLIQTLSRIADASGSTLCTTANERASLHQMLQELNSTTEKILSSTCINRPNHHVISLVFPTYLFRESSNIREDTSFMCCALLKRLLSAAIFFFTTLDQTPSRLSPTGEDQQAEIALKFVGTACKGLELAGNLSRHVHGDASARSSHELLETSVSFLTALLSKERGSRTGLTGESRFYTKAAALMKRSNVMQSLVSHVKVASKAALVATPKSDTRDTQVFQVDEMKVQIVQTIFNFCLTVAEIGKKSDDMLSLLFSAALTKMIVDNPLFIAANQQWVSKRNANEQLSAALRGYLPLNGITVDMPEEGSRTIVTGTFLSGRDDPVHLAWRTALKIMEAIVHAYSQPWDTVDSTGKHFLDTSIAFLKTYYTSLIICLEQCSSLSSDRQIRTVPGSSSAAHTSHTVLTFNALCETADILALISSLCGGTHLQMFENECYEVYHGMIRACHKVLGGLSDFLASAGTAREIFAALKDYDIKLQQESANRDGFGFGEAQVEMNPLLAGGIPNAKHEAIKHAHYANRCCALVTSDDYEGLPSTSSSSGVSPFSTSSLERDSQLSLNSPFMLRMEFAAANCVSTAITVLSETHPASSCFIMFSPEEVRHRDMLSLLREGMVISTLSEPESSGICRFYRILCVDSVRRKCIVRRLDKPVDQTEETLDVERVNGVEDMSKRMPVLTFSAAPTSFAELESTVALTPCTASLGDVISVLRWCHQCTGDHVDSDQRKSMRNVLAESASALLSTEMSLHEEVGVGTFLLTKRDELSKRVMSQLLQLFDGSHKAPRWSGRLKQVVAPSIWDAIQQQLEDELKMARNDSREKKLQSLKRAAAINGGQSPWFSVGREPAGGAQPLPG